MFKFLLSLFSVNRKYFEGVDVTNYRYLGKAKLQFQNIKTQKISDETSVFFFCRRDDTNNRLWIIPQDKNYFKYHGWITETANLWKIGELPLYGAILESPSDWLKEHMKITMKVEWVDEPKHWKPITNKPEVKQEEDNVVKVSFPQHKKDVDKEEKIE
jgi:hypothetical protein